MIFYPLLRTESSFKKHKTIDIFQLRDKYFYEYHNYKPFLKRIIKKNEKKAKNIQEMSKIKLKKKIIEASI